MENKKYLELIKKDFSFITIEEKDNLYYVYGYFSRLMFVASSYKIIYRNLMEVFK